MAKGGEEFNYQDSILDEQEQQKIEFTFNNFVDNLGERHTVAEEIRKEKKRQRSLEEELKTADDQVKASLLSELQQLKTRLVSNEKRSKELESLIEESRRNSLEIFKNNLQRKEQLEIQIQCNY